MGGEEDEEEEEEAEKEEDEDLLSFHCKISLLCYASARTAFGAVTHYI